MADRRFTTDDPYGCREDLHDAVTDPDFAAAQKDAKDLGPDTHRATWRVVVALGYCRLFGVDVGDEVNPLMPAALVHAAAIEMKRRLAKWIARAEVLGPRWEDAEDPSEAEDLTSGLLSLSMDAWAASVALDDLLQTLLDGGDAQGPHLEEEINTLQQSVEAFDEALEANLDIFSTLAGMPVLDNWRTLLAPPFDEDLPWWLSGQIEEAADRIHKYAEQSMPKPEQWAVVKQWVEGILTFPTLPLPIEGVVAAAAESDISSVAPGQTLCWISEDGIWRAELYLPDPYTSEELKKKRPISFTRRDDDRPGTAFQGEPVFLASVSLGTIDDKGQVWVQLSQFTKDHQLDLQVGPKRDRWRYEPRGD